EPARADQLAEVDLGHPARRELLGQVVLAERRWQVGRRSLPDLGHRRESIMCAVIARGLLVICAAAACGDPAHVHLVNTTPGDCGKPLRCPQTGPCASGMRVIVYGSAGETRKGIALDGAVDLSDLPPDTAQLGVEMIGDEGAVVVTGKTSPL